MGQYLRYFVWLGLAIITTGVVVGLLLAKNSLIAISLIALGLLCFTIGLYFTPNLRYQFLGFWQRRSTQTSANGLISVIALLVILGFVNFLGSSHVWKVDLTEAKMFTLAPQSKDVVKNLDKPLKVWIFSEKTDSNLKDLLENYQTNNKNFQFEFVDPDVQIGLVKKFSVKSRGEIHLEYGDRHQLVETLTPGATLEESQLTNAILNIKGDRQDHAYILQGHGEPPLDESEGGLVQAVKGLEAQGYQVSPLNLAQAPTIPTDAKAIALIRPQKALLAGEITVLEKYLDQGGGLLVLLDPVVPTGIDPLLKNWGIRLDQTILVDGGDRAKLLGQGPSTLLITQYGDHPITKAFQEDISIYQFARPLTITPQSDIDSTPLLTTDRDVWAESNLTDSQPTFDPATDRRGPLDLAIALVRNNQPQGHQAHLVVIGNATFVTNGWFSQYINGDFFLNSVNWVSQKAENPLAIRPKESNNRRLNLLPWQSTVIFWSNLVLMPLFGLVMAIALWWKRR